MIREEKMTYRPTRSASTEATTRLIASGVFQLKRPSVETNAEIQFRRVNVVAPIQVESDLDLAEVGVGEDVVANRIPRVPDAVEAGN